MIDGKIVLNPKFEQRQKSDLHLTLTASEEKIVMIEAGANEVTNEKMLEAIKEGHKEIKKLVSFISKIKEEIGKEKFAYEEIKDDEKLVELVREGYYDELKSFMHNINKIELDGKIDALINKIIEDVKNEENVFSNISDLKEIYDKEIDEIKEMYIKNIPQVITSLEKEIVRKFILEEDKRVDGRGRDDIRELHGEVALIPRVHRIRIIF